MIEPCYYFGVLGQPGHYLHRPGLRWVGRDVPPRWPFGDTGGRLDGGYMSGPLPERGAFYAPFRFQVQGHARLSHVGGWTVLAIWDRSDRDKRPGCNSDFVAKGEFNFEEMVALAMEHFPTVWKRINAAGPVIIVEEEKP